MSNEERIARTEAVFREVNEAIAKTAENLDSEEAQFVCECGDSDCADRITAELDDYERVRAHATHFILMPGHEKRSVERVVEHNGHYTVVEKVERTVARIVRAMNPRTKPKPA
jgi:hypothetical protein